MNPGTHSAIPFAKKSRALALGLQFFSSVKWGKYSLTLQALVRMVSWITGEEIPRKW